MVREEAGAAGGSAAVAQRQLFQDYFFYFHGSVPGTGGRHKTLCGVLERHGGAVVQEHTLRWACGAVCPARGHGGDGQRGRKEVVVVCGRGKEYLDNDAQVAKAKAFKSVKELLGMPSSASLRCSACEQCHILCTAVSEDRVPFVYESIVQNYTQVHLLEDADGLHHPPAGRRDTQAPGVVRPADGGKSRGPNHTETGCSKEEAIVIPSNDSSDEAIVLDDSEEEAENVKDAMQVDAEGLIGSAAGATPGPATAAIPSALHARTDPSAKGQAPLKHIECKENEPFVRHLDLLSFLLQLNVKSGTKVSEFHHPKQGESEHGKIGSWAFKQAANVIRRLPEEILIKDCDDDTEIYVGGRLQTKIFCIGQSTKDEILEVQTTGSSKRLQKLQDCMPYYPIIQELMLVHGVGVAMAFKLYRVHQIRSWQELRTRLESGERLPDGGAVLKTNGKTDTFHYSTLVSLRRFESMHEEKPVSRNDTSQTAWALRRISREQVETVRQCVHECARHVGGNKVLETAVGGSHRRGLTSTGDVDIILKGRDGWESNGILESLVKYLAAEGLVQHFMEPSDLKWLGYDKNDNMQSRIYFAARYMGLIDIGKVPGTGCQPGAWRRLDITIYERKCFVYGLFQWTGSTQLNREMRRRV